MLPSQEPCPQMPFNLEDHRCNTSFNISDNVVVQRGVCLQYYAGSNVVRGQQFWCS